MRCGSGVSPAFPLHYRASRTFMPSISNDRSPSEVPVSACAKLVKLQSSPDPIERVNAPDPMPPVLTTALTSHWRRQRCLSNMSVLARASF